MIVKLICEDCGCTFEKDVYKTVKREGVGNLHMIYGWNHATCEKCGGINLKKELCIKEFPKSKGATFLKVNSMNEQQKKEYFHKRSEKIAKSRNSQEEKERYKQNLIAKGGQL